MTEPRHGSHGTASSPAIGGDDDEIDLGKLLGTLWRGKWLIAAAMVIGSAFAAIYIANTNPTFRADALL